MKVIIIYLSILTLAYSSASADDTLNLQNDSALNITSHASKSKITAISLSTIGGAFIITSIPFYIKAKSQANGKMMIDANIKFLIGDCFFFGGLLCEGIAIPFYIKDARNNKKRNCTLQLEMNSIVFSYMF